MNASRAIHGETDETSSGDERADDGRGDISINIER
jgi:hypothetical protein